MKKMMIFTIIFGFFSLNMGAQKNMIQICLEFSNKSLANFGYGLSVLFGGFGLSEAVDALKLHNKLPKIDHLSTNKNNTIALVRMMTNSNKSSFKFHKLNSGVFTCISGAFFAVAQKFKDL